MINQVPQQVPGNPANSVGELTGTELPSRSEGPVRGDLMSNPRVFEICLALMRVPGSASWYKPRYLEDASSLVTSPFHDSIRFCFVLAEMAEYAPKDSKLAQLYPEAARSSFLRLFRTFFAGLTVIITSDQFKTPDQQFVLDPSEPMGAGMRAYFQGRKDERVSAEQREVLGNFVQVVETAMDLVAYSSLARSSIGKTLFEAARNDFMLGASALRFEKLQAIPILLVLGKPIGLDEAAIRERYPEVFAGPSELSGPDNVRLPADHKRRLQ